MDKAVTPTALFGTQGRIANELLDWLIANDQVVLTTYATKEALLHAFAESQREKAQRESQ